MQFIAISAALLATATASVIPASLEARQVPLVCPPGLMSSPNCCSAVILGVLGLDCYVAPIPVNNGPALVQQCAVKGQQAMCCTLDLLGQALLCTAPLGTKM